MDCSDKLSHRAVPLLLAFKSREADEGSNVELCKQKYYYYYRTVTNFLL